MEITTIVMSKEAAIRDQELRDMDEKGIGEISPRERYEMENEWYLDPDFTWERKIEIHPNSIGMIEELRHEFCRIVLPTMKRSYVVPKEMEDLRADLQKQRNRIQQPESS